MGGPDMFTDRFIRLPIKVYNQRQADLTGNEDTNDIFTQVVPLQIEEYYKGEDDGKEITQVFLRYSSGVAGPSLYTLA